MKTPRHKAAEPQGEQLTFGPSRVGDLALNPRAAPSPIGATPTSPGQRPQEKSEARNPKSEANPKSEIRLPPPTNPPRAQRDARPEPRHENAAGQQSASPKGASFTSPGQRPGNTPPPTNPSPERAELPELPEEWRIARLGEVVESSRPRRGGLPGTDAKIPFIAMALLPNDGLPTTRWEMRRPEEVRSGVPFVEGDVLLAKITPCLENGKLGIARGIPGGWGMTSTEVYPLRGERVTSEFLACFLTVPSVRQRLASKMQGATGRQRLPKEALDAFRICVPPLPEQRAIAGVLRTVQRAREACERVLAATRQFKQSLLHHLFTYGPVPFPQAPHVPLKETEIGPMPEHWDAACVADVCHPSKVRRQSLPSPDGRIPFIPMSLLPYDGGETTQWEMRTPDEVRSGVPFADGDVLLAKITPCLENGKLALARNIPGGWGMTSTEVYPLQPTDVTADFLVAFLSRPDVRQALASKMQGTTGRQRLPKEALDSFAVPLPPFPSSGRSRGSWGRWTPRLRRWRSAGRHWPRCSPRCWSIC